jgi:hypothetical protein
MATTSNSYYMETISLFFLNVDVNVVHVQQELRLVIDHIQTFENSNDCEAYMRQSKKNRMMLVVNGSVAEAFVPHVHDLRQLAAIYIYTFDKKKFEQWSLSYNKLHVKRTLYLHASLYICI